MGILQLQRIISEMKNSLNGLYRKWDTIERVSKLKTDQEKWSNLMDRGGKGKKKFRDIWDKSKQSNICKVGVSEKRRECVRKKYFKK